MIIPVHAANPGTLTGRGNWTYLIMGRTPVLVDAGVGERAHIDELARHLRSGPVEVIVTHAHPDHASGVVQLAERWPGARFRKMPWPERDAQYQVPWSRLENGERIDAGDDFLEVIHTPGHAPDHICLWHPSASTLFSGDLVLAGGTVVIPASHGGSLVQYLRSLRRVSELNPNRLLPAHGPPIDDPQRIIRQYLDHRRERERQVLAALEAGCTTVERITERIYAGLAAVLIPMARESVLAHLHKLEEDGLARSDTDGWRPLS